VELRLRVEGYVGDAEVKGYRFRRGEWRVFNMCLAVASYVVA
jgi:hypothetical protein